MEVELACENPECPGNHYDEEGNLADTSTWWTDVIYEPSTGASDYTQGVCPECQVEGEPTGETS